MTDIDPTFGAQAPTPMVMTEKPTVKKVHDPDKFLTTARRLVVENYNKHRDPARSKELMMDAVYVVWFSKTLSNWKAILTSPVIRGLLWEVTYAGSKRQAYIDAYKKLNNEMIPLGDEA